MTDPTGAGDAFAGGFLGFLNRCGGHSCGELRQAMLYGAAMGSFAVEAFSVDRFRALSLREVEKRARDLEG